MSAEREEEEEEEEEKEKEEKERDLKKIDVRMAMERSFINPGFEDLDGITDYAFFPSFELLFIFFFVRMIIS